MIVDGRQIQDDGDVPVPMRGVAPHVSTLWALVAAHAHMQDRGAPPAGLMRQAPDYRVTRNALAPTASTPPVLTSDTARQYCMVWLNALTRNLQPQAIQASERAQIRPIKGSIGHVEVFRMDGVGISIIERPRPLPGHDTLNPTQHTYTLKCEGPAKVARNLTRSFFAIGHKRCNFNDRISMSEICAWELRATLLGNRSDWKPTHETTYQHTRRRCDGRRMVRRARASFATRRRAKRDRQFSRADGPSDGRNNARAAAPVTGHDTRYGARHPIRRGALPTDRVQRTQSQEQTRNLRDDRRHAQGPGSSRSRGLST